MDKEHENKEGLQQEDLLKNVKSEFERKFQNLEQDFKRYYETIASQVAELSTKLESPKKEEESVGWWDDTSEKLDPQKVKEEVKKELEAELKKQKEFEAKQAQILQEIAQDFPELSDPNSEFTKAFVDQYKSLSPEEQASPLSYKAVALEVAKRLKVVPKSLRGASEFVAKASKGVSLEESKMKKETSEWAKSIIKKLDPALLRSKRRKKMLEKLKEYREEYVNATGERKVLDFDLGEFMEELEYGEEE